MPDSAKLLPGWVDREDRDSVDLEALIICPDGTEIAARVRNISTKGCFAEASQSVPIGISISIALPEMGRRQGRVRWALGTRIGILFSQK